MCMTAWTAVEGGSVKGTPPISRRIALVTNIISVFVRIMGHVYDAYNRVVPDGLLTGGVTGTSTLYVMSTWS